MRQQQEQKSTIWNYGKKLLTGTVALGATWLGYHYLSSLFETPVDRIDIVDVANDELLTLTSEMNVGIASLPAGSRHLLATPTVINNIPTQTVELGVPFSFDFSQYFNDIDGDIAQYQLTSLNGLSLPSELKFEPKLLSSLPIQGNVVSIELSSNNKTAYLAASAGGLVIVDIENSQQPEVLSSYTTFDDANDVAVLGNIAYVATAGPVSTGFEILDVSDLLSPTFLGNISTIPDNTDDLMAIKISDNKLYLVHPERKVFIYNIATPASPLYESTYDTSGSIYTVLDVNIQGSTMYVAHGSWGVRIVDLITPIEIGRYNGNGFASDIAVNSIDNILYSADGVGNPNLKLIDISVPASPTYVNGFLAPGWIYKVKYLGGGQVYLATGAAGLQVIDVADPNNLQSILHYNTPGSVRDLALLDEVIYLADDTHGLSIIDIGKQGLLTGIINDQDVLGQYRFNVSAIDHLGQVSPAIVFSLLVDNEPTLSSAISDASVLPSLFFQKVLDANLVFNDKDAQYGQQFSFSVTSVLPSWMNKERIFSLKGSDSSYGGSPAATGIYVIEKTLYLSDYNEDLNIFDIKDPSNPIYLGGLTTTGPSHDIVVKNNIAYLAQGVSGLWIVDVNNPALPVQITLFDIPLIAENVKQLQLVEDKIYLAAGIGFVIVDVSDPMNPVSLSFSPYSTAFFDLLNNIAYISTGSVVMLDVFNPSAPVYLGTINIVSTGPIIIENNILYVVSTIGEVVSADVTNPASPKILDRYDTAGRVVEMNVIGSTAFIGGETGGLIALDISDPTNLRWKGEFASSRADQVELINNIAYLADGIYGLKIIDASKLKLSGTPAIEDVGNTEITVTGTDELGLSVSTSFTLRVEGPPVQAKPLDNQSAEIDQLFSFIIPKGTFTDPNNDLLSIVATTPSWLTYNDASKVFSGTPVSSDSGLHHISMVVSDGVVGTADISSQFTVLVHASQTAVISSGHVLNFQVPANTFQGITGPLTYSATLSDGSDLPDWMTFDRNTLSFSGTPTESDVKPYSVVVTATDPSNVKYPAAFLIEATINQAPEVKNPIPNQEAKVNEDYLYTLPDDTFLDPNGDVMTYSVVTGLPSWLSFNPNTRTFSGKPGRGDTKTYADKVHGLIVQASDSVSDAKAKFTLNVAGESHLEMAIKIGAPMISALGVGVGLWAKRALILNRCKKSRYLKNDDEIIVGQEYERELKVPAEKVKRPRVLIKGDAPNSFFGKVRACFSYNREIEGGTLLSWLTYNEGRNCIESIRPIQHDDIGNYIVQIEGKGGVILEKFEIHVVDCEKVSRQERRGRGRRGFASGRVHPEALSSEPSDWDSPECSGEEMRNLSNDSDASAQSSHQHHQMSG